MAKSSLQKYENILEFKFQTNNKLSISRSYFMRTIIGTSIKITRKMRENRMKWNELTPIKYGVKQLSDTRVSVL